MLSVARTATTSSVKNHNLSLFKSLFSICCAFFSRGGGLHLQMRSVAAVSVLSARKRLALFALTWIVCDSDAEADSVAAAGIC